MAATKTLKVSGFRYQCRACGKQVIQPVDTASPEATPIPYCCTSRRRDMAFKGGVFPEENSNGNH